MATSKEPNANPSTAPVRTRAAGLAGIGALAILATGTAVAQDDTPAVFDLRSAGIEAIEPAAKDAAVYDALPRLARRLVEVPVEAALAMDEDPVEAALVSRAIDVVWSAVTGRAGLMVQPGTGPLGYGAAAWSDPSGDMTADALRSGIAALIEPLGLMVQEGQAGPEMATPFGPAPVRTLDDGAAIIDLGLDSPTPLPPQQFDLPRGVTPILSLHANVRELTAPLAPMLQAAAPEVRQQFIDGGLIGPDAPIIDAAIGTDRHLLHFAARYTDAVGFFERLGAGPEVVFTERDLRAIPRDATIATASPISLRQLSTVRAAIAAAEGEDPLEPIEQMLGLDLDDALLDNVGPRMMYYQSDSTGGGGLLSSVAIVEMRDPAAFTGTIERIATLLNNFAINEANGYIRIVERELGEHAAWSLIFPGLPIPLELSWAMHEGRLVAAATPLGLTAALDQLADPDRHINQSSTFRAAVGSRIPTDGVSSMMFVDTARFAPGGYGTLNLVMSGLANGLRNPGDPGAFDGQPLLPTYAEFVDGIRPFGAVATWDGQDYVYHLTTDRSVLVNAAVLVGPQGLGSIQAVGLAAGALIPALEQSRESARELKATAQLRQIVMAMNIYAADNRDRFPASLNELIQQGMIDTAALASPFGPAWDSGPDYGYVGGEMDFDHQRIVAIDRAMYLNTDRVAVGFGDGHVSVMQTWELDEQLDDPRNAGAREKLGLD